MSKPVQAESLVIRRRLPAPPETVWAMWTQPEHFVAWYGPAGATIDVLAMDVRIGGRRHVAMTMHGPNGQMTMWFAGKHVEVEPIVRLSYTEAMTDEAGIKLSPDEARLPAGHPAETEISIALEPAEEGTALTLTHAGIAPGSPGATGWTMALDKLADRLSQ